MPLPKPPAKKASLLSASDFDAQAVPKPGQRSTKQDAAATEGALLDLFDPHPRPPAAKAPAPLTPPAAAALPHKNVSRAAKPEPKPRKPRVSGPAKLFVLDTNVLMHDPMSLFRFEEHDIYLPMITLEELDGHKKGMSEVSRNVRQVSRELDALAGGPDASKLHAEDGIALAKTGHKEAGGKLFFQTLLLDVKLPDGLPQGKADNQILGVVKALREKHPQRDVVLVSKDINMRVKARALGLPAEDYFSG